MLNNLFRFLAFFCLLLATPLSAAESTVIPLSAGLKMDDAGQDLRRALNAWATETPSKSPLWQTLQLQSGESQAFDRFHHIMLVRTDSVSAQVMIISEDAPQTLTLEVGEQTTAGPFDVLLSQTRNQQASLLVRWNQAPTTSERNSEEVLIAGFENPERLEIATTQPEAMAFAERYLELRNKGSLHESAFAAALSGDTTGAGSLLPRATPRGVNSQDIFDQYNTGNGDEYLPAQVAITFRVIKGSDSAFRALSGAASYNSDGNKNDGAVSAKTGEQGGKVEVGRPGDRFNYELKALEKSGSIKIESESFVRTLVGESARYNYYGPGGEASGDLDTRARGRGVEVSFRQTSGDRSSLSISSSRLVFQDGQTLQVAKNSSSRTTSSSSGAPIIQDIPYIGPGLGSSQSSSQNESYALYVTVEFD